MCPEEQIADSDSHPQDRLPERKEVTQAHRGHRLGANHHSGLQTMLISHLCYQIAQFKNTSSWGRQRWQHCLGGPCPVLQCLYLLPSSAHKHSFLLIQLLGGSDDGPKRWGSYHPHRDLHGPPWACLTSGCHRHLRSEPEGKTDMSLCTFQINSFINF